MEPFSDEEGEARLTPCAIYENQRWQPIRGWGSSYPGHFLPTDRCRYNRVPAQHLILRSQRTG